MLTNFGYALELVALMILFFWIRKLIRELRVDIAQIIERRRSRR